MKQKKKCIVAVILTVCFFSGSVSASFAAGTSNVKSLAKGAGVSAAVRAQNATKNAAAENEAAASEKTANGQSVQTAEKNAEKASQSAETVLDLSGTPELSMGASFAAEAQNASEKITETYALSDYVNNDILVMYQNGDIQLLHCDSQAALAEKIAELEADKTVTCFQPNFSYESDASAAITADTYSSAQWALKNDGSFSGYRSRVNALENADVSAEKAWEYYTPKREAIIALVDTGVQSAHEELSGSFWTNDDEIAGNGVDDDGNGYIDDVNGWNFYNNNNNIYTGSTDSHGTHCAGTISAAKDNNAGIAGLADYSNIKIMTLKALGGSDGSGTTLSLTRAILYAEKKGAVICNLSLGTDSNDRLLYQVMKKSNMLFVVAAGNGDASGRGVNIDRNPSYPASYELDNIITVANLTASGALHSSSDYGMTSVDIAAPGTDIISTNVSGKYAYMTGTSMAAPFVSAAAALVYTANENLTLADTRNILLNTVKKDTLLTNKIATGGILDCGSAVAYAVTGETQDESGDADSDAALTPEEEENREENTNVKQPEPESSDDYRQPDKIPQYDFGGDPFRSISSPFDDGYFGGGWNSWNGWDSMWNGWNFRIEIPQFFQIIRWSIAS